LLTVYLQDHHAGGTIGVALFHRAAQSHRDPGAQAELKTLAHEVVADHNELLGIMAAVGTGPNRLKDCAGWLLEKAGRLKPNGQLIRRSPLSDLVELEALATALNGKAAGWRVLRDIAGRDSRLDPDQLDRLIALADNQMSRLEKLHIDAARAVFG
jgi:hypothetical protein